MSNADEVDDEDRLAAALAALALTRGEDTPIGGLARWRAQRLEVLEDVRDQFSVARPGARGRWIRPRTEHRG
jgi:hypothetical protein